MFEQIDFKSCKILYLQTDDYLKEDLLQIQCTNGRLIDAGWYGDEAGFCTKVIENCNWEKPCYQLYKPKKELMENDVQMFIDYETAEFSETISKLFDELKSVIKSPSDQLSYTSHDFIKAREILHQIRIAGVDQSAFEKYLGTYALQFREDSDERRWNFACDLLDLITGFCAPQYYIYYEK